LLDRFSSPIPLAIRYLNPKTDVRSCHVALNFHVVASRWSIL